MSYALENTHKTHWGEYPHDLSFFLREDALFCSRHTLMLAQLWIDIKMHEHTSFSNLHSRMNWWAMSSYSSVSPRFFVSFRKKLVRRGRVTENCIVHFLRATKFIGKLKMDLFLVFIQIGSFVTSASSQRKLRMRSWALTMLERAKFWFQVLFSLKLLWMLYLYCQR